MEKLSVENWEVTKADGLCRIELSDQSFAQFDPFHGSIGRRIPPYPWVNPNINCITLRNKIRVFSC